MSGIKKLPLSFFLRDDVVKLSRELLGHYLFTRIKVAGLEDIDCLAGGVIVETEAYAGARDRASHAFGGRRTKRTEIMFGPGGFAYVYLCYGMHSLFNVVVNKEGIPDAVLIRAIQPTHGIGVMLKRRKKSGLDRSVAGGPGIMSQAMGIKACHSGVSLSGDVIWIAEGTGVKPEQIEVGTRVGVQYAASDALLPWRFRVRDNAWTSRTK